MLRRPALLALLALVTGVLAGCQDERKPPLPAIETNPAPPTLADPHWRAVIDDWYDNGTFDDPHECTAVRATIDRLPRSMRDYSSIHGDIAAYADLVCGEAGRPSAPVTIGHRYVHPLPYPAGVRYTISVRPAGAARGVRWARFTSHPSYTGSVRAGEARFASVLLPPRRYVVTSSMSVCADANDLCSTMGKPQGRCARSVALTGRSPVAIKVVARDGAACRISIDR